MALEILDRLPTAEDFTALNEHEEQTPSSFFGGKPVLHLRSPSATVKISKEDLGTVPSLASLRYEQPVSTDLEGEEQVIIEDIDVWVSSSFLTLVSVGKSVAVQVPYQTITVHAQEGNAVLLGLNLSDSNTADEDLVFIQLRIIPRAVDSNEGPAPAGGSGQTNGNSAQTLSPAQSLFKAIADCQELNPDPPDETDEGYDETAPGAAGWITSENIQDFVDENGEFRLPQDTTVVGAEDDDEPPWPLGPGAGRTRTADELDNGDGVEQETKWQRTD